ncbi:MAG: Hsp20/alpha crystallin family protein [Candidatus Sungbacteria bacterium]|nr:Hsp20/alpha crystallin family protein [Candidatus Sungbacteria bacterium]
MSTFFEKLTASRPKTSGNNPTTADLGAGARRVVPASAKSEMRTGEPETASQSNSRAALAIEEDAAGAEEEGELTVDIYDKDDAIVIQSTVAGVKPEDLEVSITSDMVSIKGARQCTNRVSEDRYYYKELFWGTFSRTVILPEEIDEHNTEAALKHGLLTITLPKKKKGLAHAQKVKIKTA